jgi:hypothetical protein
MPSMSAAARRNSFWVDVFAVEADEVLAPNAYDALNDVPSRMRASRRFFAPSFAKRNAVPPTGSPSSS